MSEEILKEGAAQAANETDHVSNETKGAGEDKKKEAAERLKALTDPAEIMARISKGTIQLYAPIRADGKDVEKLDYDFTALTGRDYVEAMDKDPKGAMSYYTTTAQAFYLFCKAAAKATQGADEEDIARGMTAADTGKAVQLATTFINASMHAASKRISNR